ncbi:MAG: glycosyltransferase [Candidatus Moraniibacteriota bacterium]
MRIALVHDYLVQYGGAERVLECLSEIWPDAPIFTLVHDSEKVHHKFSDKNVKTSFLQNSSLAKNHHRLFPPVMMTAIEQFDFDKYDIVLSDSSSFAKNIITSPDTLHISYCHTPMRYAWDDCQFYIKEFSFPGFLKKTAPFFMNYIRTWDYFSTNGVDRFIANSYFVRRRIQKYYGREAEVVHPPVDVNNFYLYNGKKDDYLLVVGRMMKYKMMDLVIKACNELKQPLKIIGRGPEYKNLKKIAGPTVEFIGRVSDEELREIYSRSKAFVFPQEEDFGIVAIEALASGRPVIAYASGDIVENIEEGRTGILFYEQKEKALVEAIKKLNQIDFDPEYIREKSLPFEKEIFKEKMKNFVEKEYSEHQKQKMNFRLSN